MKTPIWTAADIPPQHGRLAVVTGATGGLGYETALELARAGATVLVTGRDQEKGRKAIERISRAVPAASIQFDRLDLADLASIRAFAEKMDRRGEAVDLLINNAGVMDLPTRRLTKDGFEMQFGTNHLGHFALTALLLPMLRKAQEARVINVSSLAHRGGKIDFANLQSERKYNSLAAYQLSKLANLLFTFELQRRSDAGGWGLRSNAAHPGLARTDLIPNGQGAHSVKGTIATIVVRLLGHSAAEGALPTLYAATALNAARNGYYGPHGLAELKGPVASAKIMLRAQDQDVAQRLWEVSEQLTGTTWPAV